MVHRDIKPANLMVARDGKKAIVKILDFGLAKVTSEDQAESSLTREGQMVGTPDYIAPEQIRDARSADIRADIYSLGCTLDYLLSGGPPFRGEHLWDMYQAHFSMQAGPLNLVRPEIPVELAAVVAKMMAKEPGRRFQAPGEVARALTPFFRSGKRRHTRLEYGNVQPGNGRMPHECHLAERLCRLNPVQPWRHRRPLNRPESPPNAVDIVDQIAEPAKLDGWRVVGQKPWWLRLTVAAGVFLFGLAFVWGVMNRPTTSHSVAEATVNPVGEELVNIPSVTLPEPPQVRMDDHGVRANRNAKEVVRPGPGPVVETPSLPESIPNSIGMTLNLIPAGNFTMGAARNDSEALPEETPLHTVHISPFYLGVHEVTQRNTGT